MSNPRRKSSPASATASTALPSSPVLQAALVVAALSYGAWLLVASGRMTWPPVQLLNSLYTIAGCLGLIGPLLLARSEAASGALGEVIWFACGMILWLTNATALARGEFRGETFATPVNAQTLGITVLAVLVAGWRLLGVGRSWAWTNVAGWLLAAFWVGIAVVQLAAG